jgi:hypothetical protein
MPSLMLKTFLANIILSNFIASHVGHCLIKQVLFPRFLLFEGNTCTYNKTHCIPLEVQSYWEWNQNACIPLKKGRRQSLSEKKIFNYNL